MSNVSAAARPALVATLAIATLMLIALSLSPTPASAGDKDCADFKSQKKAQKFFKKHDPRNDPHYLDADNDGVACEENPCPCISRVKMTVPAEHAVRLKAGAGEAQADSPTA
jgi:hypothetical protein